MKRPSNSKRKLQKLSAVFAFIVMTVIASFGDASTLSQFFGGALRVYSGSGVVLGTFLAMTTTTIQYADANGKPVTINPTTPVAASPVYFTGTNCSGTPYFRHGDNSSPGWGCTGSAVCASSIITSNNFKPDTVGCPSGYGYDDCSAMLSSRSAAGVCTNGSTVPYGPGYPWWTTSSSGTIATTAPCLKFTAAGWEPNNCTVKR